MHLFPRPYLTGTTIVACLLNFAAFGQNAGMSTQFAAEAGAYVSSSTHTPFWLRANQYGIVPNQSPAYTFRLGLYGNTDTTRRNRRNARLTVGYGLNVVANAGPNRLPYEKSVLLPEAYVKAGLGAFEFYAGRRREKFGLADSTLSTGSYAWSGNALPIPKIQLAIPVFTPIGFTKGWVAVQGNYAHGWLGGGDQNFVRNSMLHQKSLYVRLGRPSHVIRVLGGFNHQVVWGGQAAETRGIPGVILPGGQLPASLIDYFYVVTGVNSGRSDTTKYTFFDRTNRVGNHLGSIDLGIEIDLVRHTLFAYRQSLFEDGSLASLINIADGLNGLRIRRNDPNAFVRDILFELLNTTSQGGPVFIIEQAKFRGKDNYFNHQQYRDGWAYRQHTIGTPFIAPALGPDLTYPYGTFTVNNRITVVHLGVSGNLPVRGTLLEGPLTYQTKLSYSRNLGTYDEPYVPVRNQFSGYFSLVAPLNVLGGMQLTGSVAADAGGLYRNGVGAYVSIRKTWLSAP